LKADDDNDVVGRKGRRKLESVNSKPVKNPVGKIIRKDYLSTAVERRETYSRSSKG